MLRVLDRLGPRFAWRASGGASDFAHCSESRQSHKAVSSSCRGRFHARSSTDYPFTSSCSPRPDRQDAVSFRCLAGSTARKGLAPFGVCAFPSARARVSSPAAWQTTRGGCAFHRPWPFRRAAGEDTRAPGQRPTTVGLAKPSPRPRPRRQMNHPGWAGGGAASGAVRRRGGGGRRSPCGGVGRRGFRRCHGRRPARPGGRSPCRL